MGLTIRDEPSDLRGITRAHAVFGRIEELVEQRRAVYEMAIELSGDSRPSVGDELLDNPVTRGHLGEVLAGRVRYQPGQLCSLDELATGSSTATVAGYSVRVAATSVARRRLGGPLRWLAGQLGRHGADVEELLLLTEERPGFGPAWRRLVGGIELAARVAPDLVDDLLPHVALVALLRPDASGRLGSASARDYPGLLLLPAPASELEAAEALIHEGAHQKFFDLAITHSLFGPDQYAAPLFQPPWAAPTAPAWPLEQTFAAFHAYRCLAGFASALSSSSVGTEPVEPAEPAEPVVPSLLPFAARRCVTLGQRLLGQGRYLGPDGRLLVDLLLGHGTDGHGIGGQRDGGAALAGPIASASVESPRDGAVVRRLGNRTLVGRRADPFELVWVPHPLSNELR